MAVVFEEDEFNNKREKKRIILDKDKPIFSEALIKGGVAESHIQANWILLIFAILLFISSFFIFKIAGERFSDSFQDGPAIPAQKLITPEVQP